MFKRRKALHARHAAAYMPGHVVKLIRGGRPYFDLLEKMIASAQHVIHFQIYIFDDDETGKPVVQALKAAAQRGVKVYILLDGYASKNLSREFFREFREAGVHIRYFEPLLRSKKFYFGRRLHHKIVVIDAYRCLVGGLNISNRYNDTEDGDAWLDWALFAEGKAAEALARVCSHRYKPRMRTETNGDHPKHLPIAGTDSHCTVRVRINDWVDRKREISRSYLEMFSTASTRITLMSPYFLPGFEFRRKMKDAIRRGVSIRVIQAGVSDIALSKYAERYMYRWLLRNKVEIYEYQNTVLHGKIAACDGKWMTVGSYNLNNLSAYASIELNLDVDNPEFAAKVEHTLDTIIKTDCQRITASVYKKNNNWLTHVMQNLAYGLLRLMLFLFTFYWRQKE